MSSLPEVTDFCRLLLLRHPEVAPEHAQRALGAGSAPLSNRGRESVVGWLRLFAPWNLDAVHSSEQEQCRDPAAALCAAKGLEPIHDPRLRDQELGRWQGHSWEEIAQGEPDRVRDFFQDFGEVRAPDGESLGEAVERMLEWWAEVAPDQLGKTIAVVASGSLITGFTAAMLGMRLSRAVCLKLPPAGVGILDVYGNGARVTCWNPTAFAE